MRRLLQSPTSDPRLANHLQSFNDWTRTTASREANPRRDMKFYASIINAA
jgi:hypothetical protein